MGLRDDLVDCLLADDAFEQRRDRLRDRYDLGRVAAVSETWPEPDGVDVDARDRDLVARLRAFDDGPLGLTLAGPAYRDTPVIYANETTRALTGYTLAELQGENLRLLQGPDTEADAVERLHEAIDIWERVTVDLWNYRQDGTRFRNRVTLVPVPDDSGMIHNWLGVQAAVDADDD